MAREYGIPAVLGTDVATRRIPDGARVRVDGEAGTVTLLDELGDDGTDFETAPPPTAPAGRRIAVALALAGGAAGVAAGVAGCAAPGGQEVRPVRRTVQQVARTRPRARPRG